MVLEPIQPGPLPRGHRAPGGCRCHERSNNDAKFGSEAIRRSLDAHEGESISSERTLRAAVAAIDGFDGQLLYVNVDRIGQTIREALPPEERSVFDLEIAPNLEPIEAFVAGTRATTAGSSTRMMLLIR